MSPNSLISSKTRAPRHEPRRMSRSMQVGFVLILPEYHRDLGRVFELGVIYPRTFSAEVIADRKLWSSSTTRTIPDWFGVGSLSISDPVLRFDSGNRNSNVVPVGPVSANRASNCFSYDRPRQVEPQPDPSRLLVNELKISSGFRPSPPVVGDPTTAVVRWAE